MQKRDDTLPVSIFEATQRLHTSLDISEVVAQTMTLLPEILRADSYALYLKAEKASRLELVRVINAHSGPADPIIEIVGNSTPIARAVVEIEGLMDKDSFLATLIRRRDSREFNF